MNGVGEHIMTDCEMWKYWNYSLTLCAVPPFPVFSAHTQVGEFQLLACTPIVAGI